jgi:hypothetical protein
MPFIYPNSPHRLAHGRPTLPAREKPNVYSVQIQGSTGVHRGTETEPVRRTTRFISEWTR